MQLKFYEYSYNHLVEQYQIMEEQLRYTYSPKDSIVLVNKDADRHAILALENEMLVSFFVLHQREGVKPYSSNNQAILIRSFSTDFYHQGKGYVKKALQLLPAFVQMHFTDINELVLAVNIQNTAAQALYKTCGFIDEGVRSMGNKGELIIMSANL
ncbi:GNAT family acetyltransferase [Lysinibacillus contaminans]|uniref:GNAT family acetyltransferase n=1 Tax=Lysinibacillus contaminans TaxID=1293441 RepID=A0ABR5K0K5_9BACI|nr:GNAT family N-acetyltransferase [Lysinibacillus contaminans]KOS68406.1 GNAT family acetyltransferase [Lysinibacillus contaminans]